MTQFIQIHSLASYPAVLLNRDDAGLAKRLPYGGGYALLQHEAQPVQTSGAPS
jgi:hypothetical protein